MSRSFEAVQISEHVYWVGAIDWELADFHGYATERGSTYNAYLILANEVTLIDTVKAPFLDEMMARIHSVIHPKRIKHIISNHSEKDHTGALPEATRLIEPDRIFASPKGVEALQAHFHGAFEVMAVKEGESLNLGNMELSFYDARMVHWPDSMFTYLDADRILFSNDAFGMHLASYERFDDQIEDWILHHETKTYFANILWPFSPAVGKLLDKVGTIRESVDMIAPDHGPVWREGVDRVIGWYRRWVNRETSPKAVIVYDTMWDSTAKMARVIGEGLLRGGLRVKLMPLSRSDRSAVAVEVLDAAALLVGSPNLNGGLFPTLADIMAYLKGLKPKNQEIVGAAFGSYGWSPAATKQLATILEEMKADVFEQPLQIKYVPDEKGLSLCFDFGVRLAEYVKSRSKTGDENA